MINLTYSCSCGFNSGVLNDAQDHANRMFHRLSIQGTLTADPRSVKSKYDATESAKIKAREMEIMRRAKEKGLLKVSR